MRKLMIVGLAAFLFGSGTLSAAHYRLFVHGRSSDNHCTTSNWSSDVKNYWGGTVKGLSNVRYVGWDGKNHDAYSLSTCGAQRQMINAVKKFCTGSNTCDIYSHSTGGLVVGYFLRYYYNSSYRIKRVQNMASAAGGSELANISSGFAKALGLVGWKTGLKVDNSVSTSGARRWDHNNARGFTIYTTSGTGSDYFKLSSGFLPGYDDGVLANHSLCSVNKVDSVDANCPRGNGRIRERYTCWKGWNPFARCNRYFYRWTPYYTVYQGGSKHSHSDAKKDYNRR